MKRKIFFCFSFVVLCIGILFYFFDQVNKSDEIEQENKVEKEENSIKSLSKDDILKIVKDKNTALKILEELVFYPDEIVRAMIAKHPNVSPELLRTLSKGSSFYRKALTYDPDYYVLQCVTENNKTPSDCLENLIKYKGDRDWVICGNVAENLNINLDTMMTLAKHKNSWVTMKLVNNPKVVPEVLAILSTSKDNTTRERVARHKKTPERILKKLARDNHRYVVQELIENPNLTAEILDIMSTQDNDYLKERIVCHPKTSRTTLVKMCSDHSLYIVKIILKCIKKDEEMFMALSKNGNWRIQNEVARHPKTPETVLLSLVTKYASEDLLRSLLENPNITPKILKKIIKKSKSYELLILLSKHSKVDHSMLFELAKDIGNSSVHLAILKHPLCSSQILFLLSTKENLSIQRKILFHLKCNERVLEGLYMSQYEEIRTQVKKRLEDFPNLSVFIEKVESVRNPGTSSEKLTEIFLEKNSLLMKYFLDHPNVTLEILKYFYFKFMDSSFKFKARSRLLSRKDTPSDLLDEITDEIFKKHSGSFQDEYLMMIINHPNTSLISLKKIADKATFKVRKKLLLKFSHPAIIEILISRIKVDSRIGVFMASLESISAKDLEKIAESSSYEVLLAVINNPNVQKYKEPYRYLVKKLSENFNVLISIEAQKILEKHSKKNNNK